MSCKSPKSIRLWLVLVLTMYFNVSASAMPNPMAKVGSASKTVAQKTFNGAKSVAKVPVRIAKDAVIGVRDVGSSLVTHVRSAF